MGKAARWLRGLLLLGGKKQQQVPAGDESSPSKEKRRWGFARSFRDKDPQRRDVTGGPPSRMAPEEGRGGGGSYASSVASSHSTCAAARHRPVPTAALDEAEQNKRAIVVAAATAAVVRLTSSGRCSGFYAGKAEESAAIKIQTAFRAYLARRALRALRALVKLQALVRGHIVRKQAAETLRCMQALVRVQARARARRSLPEDSRRRRRHQPGPELEGGRQWRNWVDRSAEEAPAKAATGVLTDDERDDRILEVDTGRPRRNPKRRPPATQQHSPSTTLASDQNSRSFATTVQFSVHSPSSVDMPHQPLSPLRTAAAAASDGGMSESPQFYSAASSRRGSGGAAKSDCSRSFFSAYADHSRSYMANTESSRAKLRSQSAPKQRPEYEKVAAGHRLHAGAAGGAAASAAAAVRPSSLQLKFSSKAYPGSGRLDRLGMPLRN